MRENEGGRERRALTCLTLLRLMSSSSLRSCSTSILSSSCSSLRSLRASRSATVSFICSIFSSSSRFLSVSFSTISSAPRASSTCSFNSSMTASASCEWMSGDDMLCMHAVCRGAWSVAQLYDSTALLHQGSCRLAQNGAYTLKSQIQVLAHLYL